MGTQPDDNFKCVTVFNFMYISVQLHFLSAVFAFTKAIDIKNQPILSQCGGKLPDNLSVDLTRNDTRLYILLGFSF